MITWQGQQWVKAEPWVRGRAMGEYLGEAAQLMATVQAVNMTALIAHVIRKPQPQLEASRTAACSAG